MWVVLQCQCEWNGADPPLKGLIIPVDYAFVEIITPYTDVHYDVLASGAVAFESTTALDSFDEEE